MLPAREAAIQKIQEVLLGLTGVRPFGDTYPHPPTCDRVFRDPETQVNRFPCFTVLDDDGSTVEIDSMKGAETQYRHRLELEITCYVLTDSKYPHATWKQLTWSDAFQALEQEPLLGGTASEIEWGPLRTNKGDPGQVGIWIQPLTVIIDERMEVG